MTTECSSPDIIVFEEPVVPEIFNNKKVREGLVIEGTKSVADVSGLTYATNDSNDRKEKNIDFRLFSDEEALRLRTNQDPSTASQYCKDGNQKSLSEICNNTTTAVARSPDLKCRKISVTTASTPLTAKTADESDSSIEFVGAVYSHNDSVDIELLKEPSISKRSSRIGVDDFTQYQFNALVQSLANRKGLIQLEVYRRKRIGDERRTLSELIVLFSIIRGLPNLCDLTLQNFGPMSSDILTSFLNHHPTLCTFHLHYNQGTVDMELLETLAEVPYLNDLTLDVEDDFPFSILLTSKSITKLKISGNYDFNSDNVVKSMKALETNTTLKILDLIPQINLRCVRALSFAIEDNSTLERLKFSYQTEKRSEARNALLDLLNALSKNSTVEEVENSKFEFVKVLMKDKIRVDKILERNKTLQRFQFFNEVDYIECGDFNIDEDDGNSQSASDIFAQCGALDIFQWLIDKTIEGS